MCCNVLSVVLDNAKTLVCSGNDIYETTFGGILHKITFHHGVGATSTLLCNNIAFRGGRPGRSHHMLCNSITFRGGKAWEISSHAV